MNGEREGKQESYRTTQFCHAMSSNLFLFFLSECRRAEEWPRKASLQITHPKTHRAYSGPVQLKTSRTRLSSGSTRAGFSREKVSNKTRGDQSNAGMLTSLARNEDERLSCAQGQWEILRRSIDLSKLHESRIERPRYFITLEPIMNTASCIGTLALFT